MKLGLTDTQTGARVFEGGADWLVPTIVLENELLHAAIAFGRGAIVQELRYKPLNLDLLFRAQKESSSFGYNAALNTAWYECFPNGKHGGATPAVFNSVEIGPQGEACQLVYELAGMEQTGKGCSATLIATCAQTPFKLTKKFSMESGEPALYLEESVLNTSAQDQDVLWGQVPIFSAPFLEAHSRIEISAASYFDPKDEPILRNSCVDKLGVWRLEAEYNPQGQNECYLTDFSDGWYRVSSPSHKLAFELRWDKLKFPYCWMLNGPGTLALAPFTGMPGALEEGHGVISIPAGGSETAQFEARVVDGRSQESGVSSQN